VAKEETRVFTAYEDFMKSDSACAEKELMWAILQTALEDAKKTGESYRQAKQYFLSEDRKYLYSFLSICEHLELCPYSIRATLGFQRPKLTMKSRLEGVVAA